MIFADTIFTGYVYSYRQPDKDYTQSPQMFEIMAGSVSTDRRVAQNYQRIRVQKIYLNPNLVRTDEGQMDWDMALLQLSVPLEMGDNVQPVCLHSNAGPDVIGSRCYLAGWGFINERSSMKTFESLRQPSINVLPIFVTLQINVFGGCIEITLSIHPSFHLSVSKSY